LGAEKDVTDDAEEKTKNQLSSFFSFQRPPSSYYESYTESELLNDINDRDVIDEVVDEVTHSVGGRKNEKNELRVFARAFETLRAGPFAGVYNQRWVQAINDAERFLATWGEQAAALGWTADELFGLDPVAPLQRYDAMGLVWLLQGCPVVALTDLTAAIRMRAGHQLTFYRKEAEFSWRRHC
jgi:hypothetical protein